MSTLLYFFAFLLLPALFSLIFVKKIKDSKQNLPPSPPKLPIIGNLHQLQGLFHRCLHDLSKKHGPVMLLRLGFLQIVVISSSEAAEEALKTHDLECCTRPKTHATSKLSRNSKDIGFAPYGEVWRQVRKLSVLNFFSAKMVRSFRYIREEECDVMVKKLKELGQKKSPVDLSQELYCLAGSIIFRSAFAQRFYKNNHVDKEKIKEFMFELQKLGSVSSSDLFPGGLGWFLDFVSGRHRILHKVFNEVDTLLNHVIDDHLKNPVEKTNQDRPDVVDSLLSTMHKEEQDESFKLTIDHLKGIIQMMRQIHAMYGEWVKKDGLWDFVVDNFKGARMLAKLTASYLFGQLKIKSSGHTTVDDLKLSRLATLDDLFLSLLRRTTYY